MAAIDPLVGKSQLPFRGAKTSTLRPSWIESAPLRLIMRRIHSSPYPYHYMKKSPFRPWNGLASLAMLSALPSLHADETSVSDVARRDRLNEAIARHRQGTMELRFHRADGTPLEQGRVTVTQTGHAFLFGCTIFDLVRDTEEAFHEKFRERYLKLFNFAVFPFYWRGYERRQGMTGWESLMPVLAWCEENGITTKGHPLVWPNRSGTPVWLEGQSVEESEASLRRRVIDTVAGFRDEIGIWDVVNEPINLGTWHNNFGQPVPDPWVPPETPIAELADYVETAFRWAYAAKPDAELILNEYDVIAKPEIRERFDALIVELLRREVPLSGIGIQGHEPREEWFHPDDVQATLDLYARHGLPIHLTELHAQSGGKAITGHWRTGTWTREAQADFTEEFVRTCFAHPAVVSINWWGLTDRRVWLEGGGLVDEEYRPKPVYERLDQMINHEWKTLSNGELEAEGIYRFRGFFGQYTGTLTTPEGQTESFQFQLFENDQTPIVIRVPTSD